MVLEKEAQKKAFLGTAFWKFVVSVSFVALIGVGLGVLGFSLYTTHAIAETSLQITKIVDKVREIHNGLSSIDRSLSERTMALAGVMPSDLVHHDEAGEIVVHNAWDGPVLIEAKSWRGRNDAFTVAFSRIPVFVCMPLVARITRAGRDSGLIGVANAFATQTLFPMTAEETQAVCDQQKDGDASLVLTYTLLKR